LASRASRASGAYGVSWASRSSGVSGGYVTSRVRGGR
jgi:hypothetical protein